jgi:hypothetical protein
VPVLAVTLSPDAAPVLQHLGGGASPPGVAVRSLKVGEVADRLGVSTATVHALCKRLALQHVRVANAIRVPEAALAAHRDPLADDPWARATAPGSILAPSHSALPTQPAKAEGEHA